MHKNVNADQASEDLTCGSGSGSLRPMLQGFDHMVSAGHYLASHAAHRVLLDGGNAVDAGVAAGIVLGVVQSDIVNFAGVAPILVREAGNGQVWSISGLGPWPRAASLELFLQTHGGTIPAGILRTVVPAAPDAWITALARFGTMRFSEVAAAAIEIADRGFVMYPLMAETLLTHAEDYARWESSAAIYLPGGRPPAVGEVFRQRDLAASLQYMADQERAAGGNRLDGLQAARDAFYRGDIGRRIVSYHEQHGGLLSMSDLAEFSVEVTPALSGSFGQTQVYSCGFWCQGPTLLQMLHILEGVDLASLGHNSPAYVHYLTEAIKLAFADREAYYSDPREGLVPAERLLAKDYARERLAQISPDRAAPGMPAPGAARMPGRLTPEGMAADESRTDPTLDTSYVAVMDKQGNAFSATPSDGSYNTPVIPGTGLCPSARGSQSWALAGHAAAIAPGRRPRLTPNPSLAVRADGTVMPFGTPGGDVQCQAMLQAFLNVEVFNMELQQAVESPRFACYSFPSSFEPHAIQSGRLLLEDGIGASVLERLVELGHQVGSWGDLNWRAGGMCMVRRRGDNGVLEAAADPRRPAYALGW